MFITVDEGEYSDHVVYGTYKVQRDFDPFQMLDDYLYRNPDEKEDFRFRSGDFFNELLTGGYLELVETQGNLDLGSYSCASRVTFWAEDKEEQQ